ncbi:hypothetical protein [Marinoscillum sp.]|uniref:hypothetical protein n=1 Tax=Marinoscillum sp. TaxID=2024838 RepID=UPI003BAB8192
MNKLTTLILSLVILASCSPTLTVTNYQTNQLRKIKIRKINAIILKDGLVYEENIDWNTGQLTSAGVPIKWSQISAIEVRKRTFGDVLAFPLEMTGVAAAGLGILVLGSAIAEDNDSEDMGSSLITGGLLLGTGAGLNRVGHFLRPSDKKSIDVLESSQYSFGRLASPMGNTP